MNLHKSDKTVILYDAVRKPTDYITIGPIGSQHRYVTMHRTDDGGHVVRAGCWSGTLDELETRISSTDVPGAWTGTNCFAEYTALIAMCRAWLDCHDWSAEAAVSGQIEVGSRVRILRDRARGASVMAGDEGTVLVCCEDGSFEVRVGNSGWFFDAEDFELIQPRRPTVGDRVRMLDTEFVREKANDGMDSGPAVGAIGTIADDDHDGHPYWIGGRCYRESDVELIENDYTVTTRDNRHHVIGPDGESMTDFRKRRKAYALAERLNAIATRAEAGA